MDLYWKATAYTKCGKPSAYELFCGVPDRPLAELTPSNSGKLWNLWIWLPGLDAPRAYAPLEVQQASAISAVESWFGLANTERPTADSVS